MNKLLYSYKVGRRTILFLGVTQGTICDDFLIRKNRFTRREEVKVKGNPAEWLPLYTFLTRNKIYKNGQFIEERKTYNYVSVWENIETKYKSETQHFGTPPKTETTETER
jgi:hypothetical protein